MKDEMIVEHCFSRDCKRILMSMPYENTSLGPQKLP